MIHSPLACRTRLILTSCAAAAALMFFLSATSVFAEYPPLSPYLQGPYQNRAQMAPEDEQSGSVVPQMPPVPADFAPWWSEQVRRPMHVSQQPMLVSLESLILGALMHSSQVKVFSDLPLIRRTAIVEADAAFDWTAFLNTRWNDISEPVGSTLTIGPGGGSRYSDHKWEYEMGLKKRVITGGEVSLRQEFGWEDTNSTFFIPPTQGTSRLALNFTQPLLRGAGKCYNTSLIVLAEIDAAIAEDELSRQLQSHLLEVVRAFWALYLERGSLLQKQRLYDRAKDILAQLEPRIEIDAPLNQVKRARAAVAARKADLFRAQAAIRNAEARIRALVNDPALTSAENMELVPQDQPTRELIPVSMRESLTTALQYRPEVNQSLKQVKAAGTRLDMSKRELLPVLDLIMEAYVSGLRGSGDFGTAWGEQFTEGAPSYAVGLQFEMPIHNRAAKARLQRRQLELRQVTNQFRTTAETLMLEVEVAVREVTTSFNEMSAKFESMQAAGSEANSIQQRWQALAGDDRNGALVLEDLLAAQERLADAEMGFLGAEVTYNLAMTNLKRATGMLLQSENIHRGEAKIDCLPEILFDKDTTTHGYPAAQMPNSAPYPQPGPPAELVPTPGAYPSLNAPQAPTSPPNKTAWQLPPRAR